MIQVAATPGAFRLESFGNCRFTDHATDRISILDKAVCCDEAERTAQLRRGCATWDQPDICQDLQYDCPEDYDPSATSILTVACDSSLLGLLYPAYPDTNTKLTASTTTLWWTTLGWSLGQVHGPG